MENNKNNKSVKFQGDMLNFCDFIQVFVFSTNHHLKILKNYYLHAKASGQLNFSFGNESTMCKVIVVMIAK